MFWMASQEGLVSNATGLSSVYASLRTRLSGATSSDHEDDEAQNWIRFSADDIDGIDDIGTAGIMRVLGTQEPVYFSLDIDVLDPVFAPGTGTPAPGGWTTRELVRILRTRMWWRLRRRTRGDKGRRRLWRRRRRSMRY